MLNNDINDIKLRRKLKIFNEKKPIDFYLINYYLLNYTNMTHDINNFLAMTSLINENKKITNDSKLNTKIIIKSISGTIISYFLIKTYRSIVIVPLFWSIYYIISKLEKVINNNDNFSKCTCAYCILGEERTKNNIKYRLYNDYMNKNAKYIIEDSTNYNITKELTKYINELL